TGRQAYNGTKQCQQCHRQQHLPSRFMSGSMLFRSRYTQKNYPVNLDKAGYCQPADHGQGWSSQGSHCCGNPGSLNPPEKTEIDQKFADKAVEGWQPADRHGADTEQERRAGKAAGHSPEQIDFAGPAGMYDRPGAQKKERLEGCVIENMQQGSGHAEGHHGDGAGCLSDQRHPDPHEDDADIFNAVISQQPFQVVLADGKGYPDHARDHSQEEYEAPPPERHAMKERKSPYQTVDTDLEDDSGHGGRDVTWGAGMGRREPDVERHDPRFHSETEEGGQEYCGCQR